jgi:hypothetical protein
MALSWSARTHGSIRAAVDDSALILRKIACCTNEALSKHVCLKFPNFALN